MTRSTFLRRILSLIILVSACSIPSQLFSQSNHDWIQIHDFVPTGIHAYGNRIVAWNAQQISISNDGGLSWSTPLQPQGSKDSTIIQAVAWRDQISILLSDGRLMPGNSLSSRVTVDGQGNLYHQTLSGKIIPGSIAETEESTAGTLLAPLAEGVLFRDSQGQLGTLSASGVKMFPPQTAGNLPRFFALAALTGTAGDWVFERAGRGFALERRGLPLRSERPFEILSWWQEQGVRYELIRYQDQLQILEHRRIQRTHLASRGLPQDTILLTASSHSFIAVTHHGIWKRFR